MPLFPRNCRQVTRIVLEGEDRRLGLVDRLAISFHMLICEACPRVLRQTRFMRHAVGRWRHYRDEGP